LRRARSLVASLMAARKSRWDSGPPSAADPTTTAIPPAVEYAATCVARMGAGYEATLRSLALQGQRDYAFFLNIESPLYKLYQQRCYAIRALGSTIVTPHAPGVTVTATAPLGQTASELAQAKASSLKSAGADGVARYPDGTMVPTPEMPKVSAPQNGRYAVGAGGVGRVFIPPSVELQRAQAAAAAKVAIRPHTPSTPLPLLTRAIAHVSLLPSRRSLRRNIMPRPHPTTETGNGPTEAVAVMRADAAASGGGALQRRTRRVVVAGRRLRRRSGQGQGGDAPSARRTRRRRRSHPRLQSQR